MLVTLESTAFTVALRIATERALAAYPADRARILRGAELVKHGHVDLLPDRHIAKIRSGSDSAHHYMVNGVCQCQGWAHSPGNRCSHRYAKSLYVKALTQMHSMWYAEYYGEHGVVAQTKDGRLAFFPDNGDEDMVLMPWNAVGLQRLGQCDLVDAA